MNKLNQINIAKEQALKALKDKRLPKKHRKLAIRLSKKGFAYLPCCDDYSKPSKPYVVYLFKNTKGTYQTLLMKGL